MGSVTLNNSTPYEYQAEILRAMAHPARLRLLAVLLEGPACVGELVERTGYRQPTVSQHLARLREAGLVEGIREGMTVRYHVTCPQTEHFLSTVGMLYQPHAEPDEFEASTLKKRLEDNAPENNCTQKSSSHL